MAAKNTKRKSPTVAKPPKAAKSPAKVKPLAAAVKATITKPARVAAYTPPSEELLAQLRALAPEAFCEGRLDAARLADLVGKDNAVTADAERYYFTWAGRRETTLALQLPPAGALAPCRAESVDFDRTANIYIEAENLEALKLMKRAYAGRVKMIYIDPPYNTGSDFVYADNFRDPLGEYLRQTGQVDETGKIKRAKARAEEKKVNGRKHSRWLSMMYSRLFLARSLLREDGVIFVSIDDNEVHHLRLVMNLLFGEENFVVSIPWQSRQSVQNDTDISESHQYVLGYAKSRRVNDRRLKESNADKWYRAEDFSCYPLSLDKSKFSNLDDDPRGGWKSDPFDAPNVRRNLLYPISNPITGEKFLPPNGRCWRMNEDAYKRLLADNRIRFGKDGKGRPSLKVFYEEKKMFGSVETSWFDGKYADTTTTGTKQLQALFDGVTLFDNPKPTKLIKRLLTLATRDDHIVLDFFSGSATTAHAVMELNAEDGGNRRCISVQLPEPCADKSEAKKAGYANIADIGKERLRRAAKKIRETLNGNDIDTGFRVYKLGASNFRRWAGVDNPTLENWADAQEELLDPIRTNNTDAIIAEVMLRECYPLDSRIEEIKVGKNTVYKITDDSGDKTAHICLDKRIPPRLDIALNLKADSVLIVRDIALTDEMAMNFALRCKLKVL